ncbi:hypothetical protein Tco_0405367 [Tanacetum coccineum]
MHDHGHPELAKKLNNKIPKTVDKMFERVRAFIRGKVVWRVQQKWPILLNGIKGMFIRHGPEIPKKARSKGGPRGTQRNIGIYTPYPRKDTFTPLIKSPKEILAMESVSFPEPPPLIKTPKKQNLNNFYGHHGDRGHNTNDFYQLKKQIEEVVASGKLAHLVKDICQNNQRNGNELTFPAIPQNQLTDEPIILEGMIKVRFSRETYHPLRIIDLRVTMGKAGRNKTVLMEFAIIKCRSPYNVIIGRTGMRSLRAVGSTIHSMIKFPTKTKERNERRQVEKLCGNVDSWKGCKGCERQENWIRVLTRLIDDLLALDSIVHFGSSNRRLELTATYSISTNSE